MKLIFLSIDGSRVPDPALKLPIYQREREMGGGGGGEKVRKDPVRRDGHKDGVGTPTNLACPVPIPVSVPVFGTACPTPPHWVLLVA